MKLRIDIGCDVGRVRSANEDMVLAFGTLLRNGFSPVDADTERTNGWIAVSDGMGGHLGGAYASQYVLMQLNAWVSELPTGLLTDELNRQLTQQVGRVHAELNALGQNDPTRQGLGATFVGLLFYENRILLANIGDSRLYRYRNSILAQLTRDHTLRASTGDASVSRSVLTNSFGGGVAGIEVDIDDLTDRFFHDDCYLLCSDGLYEHLCDALISDVMLLENPAKHLIRLANETGGTDNISVVVILPRRETI